MRIHLISIGGAAMHNIALDMLAQGHEVTGSDDEIYQPSLGRLQKVGLAPLEFGWFPRKITSEIDVIILGMHAKLDNPELIKAQELGLEIYSYPSFIYEKSKNKKRVVIAGSHGKTTTTAMILHVLGKLGFDFDYLVGAQLEGFDRMVKLSDAPLIIIEGDEYLSSPLDRIPKIHHYRPHISVLTGIAWDHINVFPSFDIYKEQFSIFLDLFEPNGKLFFYKHDQDLQKIVSNSKSNIESHAYDSLAKASRSTINYKEHQYNISVIGNHNLQNMEAARLVCQELDIEEPRFFEAISDFTGANKRLQIISSTDTSIVFLDFAHAPSKVKATTTSVKDWFGDQKLLAIFELHTFSSLNNAFLPEYLDALQSADDAVVFYNLHTLEMKNMPVLDHKFIKKCFNHPSLKVITDEKKLAVLIKDGKYKDHNILMMTSGNFNKMPLQF